MNDLDSKIAEEIDDEALFRLAEGEEREFSPEYQQSMEQLYRKATAHPKRRRRPVRRIIAIAAIIAVLTGAAAATFWEEIQQFFVTTFGQYAVLQTGEATSPAFSPLDLVPEEWDSFWYPKRLEDECGFVSAQEVGTRRVITFQNATGEFKLFQWGDKRSVNVDNEATHVSGIYINNKEVYATEKEIDGGIYRTIVWSSDNMFFELRGAFSFDELCEIAESLVLIER